jgi:hypothetical protein
MRYLAFACVLVCGCSIADFDVDQPVQEQMVQGSGIPAPLAALFPLPLSLDLTAKIKAHDTGPIDSVTLSDLSLTITKTDEPSGDSDDWSFVQTVTVTVESTQSGSTLPKVQIASASSPGAVKTMTFVVDESVNLKPYIDEGSKVESSGTGTVPPDDVSYDGASTFHVHPL